MTVYSIICDVPSEQQWGQLLLTSENLPYITKTDKNLTFFDDTFS